MTKHLADKRKPSTGARLRAFLRLARPEGQIWHSLWRQLWGVCLSSGK